MHIPLISRLAPLLIPYLSPSALPPESKSSEVSFEPIHAFAHTTRIILHDAQGPSIQTASFDTLSADEKEEYLLDTPRPDLLTAPLSIRTKPTIIRRPRIRPPSIISWALSAQRARNPNTYANSSTWTAPAYDDHDGWEDVEVSAPDVTDRQTLIAMAKMASNAYTTPDVDGEWWPLGNWNQTTPFGWEKDADGLRGHVVSVPISSAMKIMLRPVRRQDQFNSRHSFKRYICRSTRLRRTNGQERQVQCKLAKSDPSTS
jgi:lipase ATG15